MKYDLQDIGKLPPRVVSCVFGGFWEMMLIYDKYHTAIYTVYYECTCNITSMNS